MKVVYRHRRNDTNKIFYVGMGTKIRPYTKAKRSDHWNRIVNKAGYTIEVVAEGLTTSDALELEAFMIEEYGLDNLCNHTTGGECFKHSEESKAKMGIKGIRKVKKVKVVKGLRYNSKPVIHNNIEYRSASEASRVLGISRSSISGNVSGASKTTRIGVFKYKY